jgi:hypothetical protein
MTKQSGGPAINQGKASRPASDESAPEFDATGNVEHKGGKPSPADRDRGETASNKDASIVDLETAHDRAS